MSQTFAIYGNPVKHSKSPQMHNRVFTDAKYDATYIKILLEDGTTLRENFFEHNLDGANITVPHKEAAYAACDEIRGFAKKVKVVNTIVREDNKLIGYNTDADGFLFALEQLPKVRTILVLGAGGTSMALTQKLLDEGYDVTVTNRSQARLEAFKSLPCETYTHDTLPLKAYDLLLNTTSAGLDDDNLPLDANKLTTLFKQCHCVADAIYGKITPFLHMAAEQHLPYIDGEAMLIGQGVLANYLFTHGAIDKADILASMQASFR